MHTNEYYCQFKNIHMVPKKNDPLEYHERYQAEEEEFKRLGLNSKMVYTNKVIAGREIPQGGISADDESLDISQDSNELFTTVQEIEELNDEFPSFVHGSAYRPRTTLSHGQMKLFLTVFQFLLYYSEPDEEVHIVYPGSAPGSTLPLIFELFPMTYWYLYDPSSFDPKLKNHPNIIVQENEFFTIHTCRKLKRKLHDKKILFISDIRTLDPSEEDIEEDMQRQRLWVEELKPVYSQLKFKLPYDYKEPVFKYFNGPAYIQAFAKTYSKELRLVVDGTKEFEYTKWNIGDYDTAMYLFNVYFRTSTYKTRVKNKYVGDCHDCVMFIKLMQDYKLYGHVSSFKNLSVTKMIDHVTSHVPGFRTAYMKNSSAVEIR